MRLNVKQIVACTGGSLITEPIDASRLITGLTWDSRTVKPGDIYVALPGERVDGHKFVSAALTAGAGAVLVMQQPDSRALALAREMGAAVIEVPDTASAVSDIASEWRSHLKGLVIGITGSTGKTTTKNLVRDVLARSFTTVATAGNQNNELGAPKTILAADADTQMVVVEMGMCARGEIAALCAIARPSWGVIVNVGESHIEQLGSREGIACAKAELFQALPEGRGCAFMNADSDFADFIISHSHLSARQVPLISFDGSSQARARRDSASPQAGPAVWAEDIVLDGQGHPHFRLHAAGFEVPGASGAPADQWVHCTLGLRGVHNVGNACAAAAVGLRAGMRLEEIACALAEALPEAGRQEVIAARGGFTVVNDAYNASPDSMRASLAAFCAMDVAGRRIAVLGDMGELGDFAQEGHADVGAYAARLPLDRLLCVGPLAAGIADAAEREGMDPARILRADSVSQVLGDLDSFVEPGDAVLVKASHFMGFERIVEGLVN